MSQQKRAYREYARTPSEHKLYSLRWFEGALSALWADARNWITVDWSGFEDFTRECLASRLLSDAEKVKILKEGVGAFTGRGVVD